MEEAWIALRLTLKVAGMATVLNIFLGVGIAYFFARKNFWGKDFLDAVLTLPMVMPPTVLGYYLLVLLGRNGSIGQFLAKYLGINLIFTWQGAVIAAAIVSFPLVFKAARAAFESLESQYLLSGHLTAGLARNFGRGIAVVRAVFRRIWCHPDGGGQHSWSNPNTVDSRL